MEFKVNDAPSQAQSIDIEEWKKERNEEMKALNTVTLYKKGGRSINVNEDDVSEYVDKREWSRTIVVDKPVTKSVVAPQVTPKPTNTVK